MANVKILERKQAVIDEIAEKVKSASTVVFFEYRGLTVGEMTELRRGLLASPDMVQKAPFCIKDQVEV